MNTLDSMLERNRQFATRQSASGTLEPWLPTALAKAKAVIIGCADMRVDPERIFGLNAGEAVVLRNVGGRVTPGLIEQLALLGRIGQVAQALPGGGGEFHLIVLHHTDCGITRLAGDANKLSGYFQVPENEVPIKAVSDPHAAVRVDVAALRGLGALPSEWLTSGVVYDVRTGLAEVVVPPVRSRGA